MANTPDIGNPPCAATPQETGGQMARRLDSADENTQAAPILTPRHKWTPPTTDKGSHTKHKHTIPNLWLSTVEIRLFISLPYKGLWLFYGNVNLNFQNM